MFRERQPEMRFLRFGLAGQNPNGTSHREDGSRVCHRYNEEKATSPFAEWSPLSFEVFEDVVERLVDSLFQTLADDVVHHFLN